MAEINITLNNNKNGGTFTSYNNLISIWGVYYDSLSEKNKAQDKFLC